MNNFFIFDTNTLLSAVFNENSSPGLALKKARITGTLLVSNDIIAEYLLVFTRQKFDRWLPLRVRVEFIENIIANSLIVQITEHIKVCRDSKDDMYLSLAVTSQADCIITGDEDLLQLHPFKNISILNASSFLNSNQF